MFLQILNNVHYKASASRVKIDEKETDKQAQIMRQKNSSDIFNSKVTFTFLSN